MFSDVTSLIIPTRNRPDYLKKTLNQINIQKISFQEIIVVDSSDEEFKKEVVELIKLYDVKLLNSEPSTSIQRNIGIKNTNISSKFIMFLDDDIIFTDRMFYNMNKTITGNLKDENIVGYGFNQISKKNNFNFLEKLKNNFIFNFFDLYPNKPGKVAKSGWQSKILNIEEDITVDWIYTTACIFKYEAIKNLRFNENFGSYSYLEDLEFSLNFFKSKKKIIISSDAKYFHPLSIDRSSFKFGLYEVRNRFKIIKKYNFSKSRFFIMTFARTFMFILNIFILKKKYFYRALGNIYGVINCYKY